MSSRAEHYRRAEELLLEAEEPNGRRLTNQLIFLGTAHAILASVVLEGPDE